MACERELSKLALVLAVLRHSWPHCKRTPSRSVRTEERQEKSEREVGVGVGRKKEKGGWGKEKEKKGKGEWV
eukprot:2703800-Rhodomonas_salina.1